MKILLIGGRGFLGNAVKKSLKKFDVYTFDRNKGGKKHVKGNLLNEEDVKKGLKGFDVIVNLVGLSPLKEPKISYSDVHVKGVRNILFSMSKKQRLIHISALGANSEEEAEYLRTKGKAEELIRNSGFDYHIIRPSVLFDNNHEFFNQLDKTKYLLFFPNIKTLVQPVHREDVAKVVKLIVENKVEKRILEIGGENKFSIYQMAKIYINSKGFPVIKIPWFLFRRAYAFIGFLKLFGITKNQVLILYKDNIPRQNDLLELIKPISYYDWVNKI